MRKDVRGCDDAGGSVLSENLQRSSLVPELGERRNALGNENNKLDAGICRLSSREFSRPSLYFGIMSIAGQLALSGHEVSVVITARERQPVAAAAAALFVRHRFERRLSWLETARIFWRFRFSR